MARKASKTVIIDARNLVETTDDFEGFYLIDGERHEADGIDTGWQVADLVVDKLGEEMNFMKDYLGEEFSSGLGGRHLSVNLDPDKSDEEPLTITEL
jgi:hypothetical protein